jgi:tetratricopeptide (TPR) repeat protein
MGRISQFVSELRRRNVIRAGAAYLVLAWVIVQVADVLLETFSAPDWIMQTFVGALAIGFPVTLILSWVYEITTSGVKRTEDVEVGESITTLTGRKLDFIVIGVLTVAVAMFAIERFVIRNQSDFSVGTADKNISLGILPFSFDAPITGNHFRQLRSEIGRLLRRSKNLHIISDDAISILPSGGSFADYATQVGSRFLVSGILSILDGNLNLNVEIYDREKGTSIWEDNYTDAHLPQTSRLVALQIANTVGDSSFEVPSTEIDQIAYEKYLKAQQLYTSESELDEAEQLLRETIQISSRFSSAYAAICRLYLRRYIHGHGQSYFSMAEQNCLRAWTLDSESADVLYTLAELSFTSGQKEKTRDYAEAALAINPGYLNAQILLAESVSQDSPEIAELQYKSIIARNPGSPDAYDALQRLYFQNGRSQEAIEIQQIVVRLKPDDDNAKFNMSSNLLMAGRFQEARTFIEEVLDGEPNNVADFKNNLATANYFAGDFEGAAKLYEESATEMPEYVGIYRNWGDAIWQIGGKAAAEPIFRKVIQLAGPNLQINPESLDLLDLLVAYGSLGRNEEYQQAKQQVLAVFSRDPQAIYSIAVCESRLGEFETSRRFAQQAYDLGFPAVFLNADPDILASGASF